MPAVDTTDGKAIISAKKWAEIVNELFEADGKKSDEDFQIPDKCTVTADDAKAYCPLPKNDMYDGIEDFWEWLPLGEGVLNGIRCRTPVVNIAKKSPNFRKTSAFFWHMGPNYGELTIDN